MCLFRVVFVCLFAAFCVSTLSLFFHGFPGDRGGMGGRGVCLTVQLCERTFSGLNAADVVMYKITITWIS